MISDDMAGVLLCYGGAIILFICGLNEKDRWCGAPGVLFTWSAALALFGTVALLTIGN